MPTVLIVDDDPKIRSMLRRYLEGEAFAVQEAADSDQAYAIFAEAPIDLILLDLSLPGDDGLTITRTLRAQSDVPIIMLTGKDDPVDKAIGLEVGADDYVAKPFHLRELLARIKTVLRRQKGVTGTTQERGPVAEEVLKFDDFEIDLQKRQVRGREGNPLDLTSAEYKLLVTFVRHPNRVLSRDQLLDHIAGRPWEPYDRTIDTQVRRLRLKLEKVPEHPELIKTVRGEGYVFAAAVQPA